MENDTSVAKYLVGCDAKSKQKGKKDIPYFLISSDQFFPAKRILPLEHRLSLCLPASRFQKISIPHPDNPEQVNFANNPMLGSNSS